MTIANDILNGIVPDFDRYVHAGESLDDIDEYGFTPLIETAITKQPDIALELLNRGVGIDVADVTGRTPLYWAVDYADEDMIRLLLSRGANPNQFTIDGQSILVYPLLRRQETIKRQLLQAGANLDFAMDFIQAKGTGHRYELVGNLDVLTPQRTFIELNYEGFVLEFTVSMMKDSLRRFMASYATKSWHPSFHWLHPILESLRQASHLLKLQQHAVLNASHDREIADILETPLLILPVATRGHALCFIRYQQWWVKIDRGENSQKEGAINVYQLTHPERLTVSFIHEFLYRKQSRDYFHKKINGLLGLIPYGQLAMTSQIAGNCSWANIQAALPAAVFVQMMAYHHDDMRAPSELALGLFDAWVAWDQDRALDECLSRFKIASKARQASMASLLGAVLFQRCDYGNPDHMKRAEKILTVLTLPDFRYVLNSYLHMYCVKNFTRKGNNLLKILDECGVNSGVTVNPIATGLEPRK
jgi:hypothetical protein